MFERFIVQQNILHGLTLGLPEFMMHPVCNDSIQWVVNAFRYNIFTAIRSFCEIDPEESLFDYVDLWWNYDKPVASICLAALIDHEPSCNFVDNDDDDELPF